MESAIEFLEYELKRCQHQLNEEEQALIRLLASITTREESVAHYKGRCNELLEAVTKLKESI